MISPEALRKIAVGLLVMAVPGIACHGFYAYEAAAGASAVLRMAIVLGYPALLIASVGAVVWLCKVGVAGTK